MRTKILDNDDFAYFADVAPIPLPVGGYALTITSLWRSAKDPLDEQVQFKACLDKSGLQALVDMLQLSLRKEEQS